MPGPIFQKFIPVSTCCCITWIVPSPWNRWPIHHFSMAEPEKSVESWWGEVGFIRREMLELHLPAGASPIYYFAGPPPMTMAMRQMLDAMGVGAQDMRYEEFYGY